MDATRLGVEVTSTQLTNIIGDVIVILGLIVNYLKTRSVGKAITPAAPTPPAYTLPPPPTKE